MPRQTANPRDLTGLTAERLATRNEREVKEAQARMSTITPVEFDAEVSDKPEVLFEGQSAKYFDYDWAKIDPETGAPEANVTEVEVPRRKLRVNGDLEDITFGEGNTFSLYVGRLYDVPAPLYDHLEEKGYVWH